MSLATTQSVDDETLAAFERTLRGQLLRPDSVGYEEARAVWNGMIDRRPALIVRAAGAADVMAAVRFARERGLRLAVRGGGHNVAGSAVVDDGLVVDLSGMRSVRVDPERRVATVEPGARMHDLDHETQAFGLATPGGFVSTTGVAGLTLGGGFGWLSRRFGLTADNLRAVDVVTADGEFLRASADENPDLFWALRGGGGNFGVVTAFEFDLHEVGPQVVAGVVAHPFADAPEVMRDAARLMREAPRELTAMVALRHAPPAPFLPEEVHGKLVLMMVLVYSGDPADADDVLAPFRGLGSPIADTVGPVPYEAFQTLFDAANGPGARNYWKSHNLPELSDGAIDTLCELAETLPSGETAVGAISVGGAVNDVPADATAYPHRDATWVLNVTARWREAADDERVVDWTRSAYEAMVPYASEGVYVNFISELGDEDRVRAAYRGNYNRLAEVKARYDPDNVFRANQNVAPATR